MYTKVRWKRMIFWIIFSFILVVVFGVTWLNSHLNPDLAETSTVGKWGFIASSIVFVILLIINFVLKHRQQNKKKENDQPVTSPAKKTNRITSK